MGKSTISMVMFHSFLLVYQRVHTVPCFKHGHGSMILVSDQQRKNMETYPI